ncbi:DUF4387 domain-containing protein [Pseudorhodoferax sp.]|uniref:DUF4387 domain-containing protein n=1 Tax=Pseudorhodoferax sp. TaxID=1993553 RepID=UPI002DD6A603|nr:DUF4387 domain-containing protein [Pseudorhodoferax sp.]
MPRIQDLASVLRSKNAGPFQTTIDLMFDDEAAYRRVLASAALQPARIAALYGTAEDQVRIVPFDRVRAIKVCMPRRWGTHGSGSAFDRDVYGAQQHGLLADQEVEA